MLHPFVKPTEACVLVINSGSSTIKYQLLNPGTETVWLKGIIDGIGQAQGKHDYLWIDNTGRENEKKVTLQNPDYCQSFTAIVNVIKDVTCHEPTVIGHRVVHGGEDFVEPIRINSEVIAKIEKLSLLAPLHNPANVRGIRTCFSLYPHVPQVAVFDTAFHQSMPEYAYRYAVPDSWYSKFHVRKYGFHGSSHRYIAHKAANYLQKPLKNLNLITLHLGNGASIAAVEQGKCIDTSMGFTPLEGLIMGTRCGDIDPSIPLYIQQLTHSTATQVSDDLNHRSGLLGLTGNQDMRELLSRYESGDTENQLAINMYCYRIKKYIGSYSAALGRLDAIIFTGGIGENSSAIRKHCCQNLSILGIAIDDELNTQPVNQVKAINPVGNKIDVLVIRTNEELQIAHEAMKLINC